MSLDVGVNLQTPTQRARGVVENAFPAVRRERRRVVEVVEDEGQSLTPGVGFGLGEAGALGGQLEDIVGGRDVVVFAHDSA